MALQWEVSILNHSRKLYAESWMYCNINGTKLSKKLGTVIVDDV